MSKALATKNVAAVLLGIGMILSTFAFATPANAQSTSDLQAQINALLAQIAALQGSSSSGSTSCTFTFTANLKLGSKGTEVMNLQKFLNKSSDTQVAATGAGSPGNETSTFGPATKAAVIKFQNKYAADILTPSGLTKGTGNWFAATRAKANALCTTTGTPTTPTTPGTTPGSLSVSAGSQPANSLAPQGASRVPFTNFTLTNTSSNAVVVNGITVTRTGLASDAVFAGVVLIDQNGLQIGTPRTFDTNHQATIGETMTLQPGQTMTFTVAGNMAASLSAYAGQVAALQVTGVNTSSTVSGSLPISGANQTINASLSIGTATANVSSFDPASGQTKNIGDTAVKFSGVRITAGSAEDVRLFSVRWRLNGTVSPSDVANVMVVVNGTNYPATMSADGRYATANIAGGLLITKGNSADMYIQGDITGSNASGRTVQFDIDKASDIYIVGQTYGYGITPTVSGGTTAAATLTTNNTSGYTTAGQPFFQGARVTVTGASVTTISRASEVPSQNVAVNVPAQPMGGFVAEIRGEPVTVQTMTISVATSSGVNGQLTNVTLVNDAGVVVAGPVDASANVITFNNSITLSSGRHVYTIKATVPTGTSNGATFALSTTPSNWTGVTGQISGNTVSDFANLTSPVTMNTMTVRGAALSVSAGTTPAAQTIVGGGQGVTLGSVQLDASQSGEDIRMNNVKVVFTLGSAVNTELSSCQVFNGTTALNTGSNVVNSPTLAGQQFTFDNSLIVAKGTVVTLTLKCNIASSVSANDTFQVGVNSGVTFTGTGVQSGNTVTPTITTGNSGVQTVGASSLTAALDSSSPSYTITAGGSTGVTVGAIRFRGTGENMTLQELGLTGSTGANTDIVRATIWNGATQVGSVIFTSSSSTATSTMSSTVNLPKDTDVVLTIKVDTSAVGTGQSGTAGNLVQVNFSGARATGVESGNTIWASGTATVSGVRIERSYPTVSLVSLSSSGVLDGKLMRFSVTANAAGSIGVEQFAFTTSSTTGVTVASMQLYAFTDSGFSNAVSAAPSGLLNATPVAAGTAAKVTTDNVTGGVLQIPAGQTYYFELRGTVTSSQTTGSVSTTLLGDAAYQRGVGTTLNSARNFVWTPNSTTTISGTASNDFVSGYGIPGLPTSGLTQTRSQ